MAKTNVFMNWKEVTVTPVGGGGAIAITEVVDVEVMDKDDLEPWQADGHKFPTLLVAASGMRGLTIQGGSINKLSSIPKNTPCTVVAKLYDAKNGAGEGCLVHTLSNAVLQGSPSSGKSNKFAGGSAVFVAYSSDGTVDPLVVTEVGPT